MTTWADALLAKCRLDRGAVVRALARTPAEVAAEAAAEIRAAAQRVPKGTQPGDHRLPRWVVAAMWRDYQRLRSTRKVGALYGRSGSAVRLLFRSHGYAITVRKPRGCFRVAPALVAKMHADYLRLRSMRKVGRLYGRSHVAVSQLFAVHGYAALPDARILARQTLAA